MRCIIQLKTSTTTESIMNNQRRKEIDKIMAEVEELKSRIESLQVEEQFEGIF